jgi:hypothetical protein
MIKATNRSFYFAFEFTNLSKLPFRWLGYTSNTFKFICKTLLSLSNDVFVLSKLLFYIFMPISLITITLVWGIVTKSLKLKKLLLLTSLGIILILGNSTLVNWGIIYGKHLLQLVHSHNDMMLELLFQAV